MRQITVYLLPKAGSLIEAGARALLHFAMCICVALWGCGESDQMPRESSEIRGSAGPSDTGGKSPKAGISTEKPSVEPALKNSSTEPIPAPTSTSTSAPVPEPTLDELLGPMRSEGVAAAWVISRRTQSLKLKLANGDKAVFKPIRIGDPRPPHEVAVFRLARLLDVGIVPVSTMRTLPLKMLLRLIRKRFPDEAVELEKNALVDNNGRVTGAIIQWLDGIDPSRLKALGGRSRLMQWLSPARPGGSDPPLAAATSATVVFDYVTGNWDRFSGGNIFVDESGDKLVLIDHNSTFAPWTIRQGNRMESLLKNTERFSARLIQQLKELGADDVESALAGDPWHGKHGLLTAQEVKLLLKRRDKVMAHVNHLIRRHGKEAVLCFD